MDHTVTILMTEFVTHDVKRFILTKPEGFSWQPGQGVELAINQPQWREDGRRPFTPTCLASDRVLEFTIKRYVEDQAVTDALHALTPGDELLLSGPFGSITYQGPGTFIAAGAGLTPFLAISRQLARDGKLSGHQLLFSNKAPEDVLCEKELRYYFGKECLLTCTREQAPGYGHRRIDKAYLRENIKDLSRHCYICGPSVFVEEVKTALTELGVSPELLVFEK
jgi:ferredoxin-NADP reductase